jgi:predicted MFS family arabinose efflux permease
VAAVVAGLGNSVFHPADFALLNRRVSSHRLGHAFSVHGLSGNLGWAAAPILLTAIAAAFDWRIAGLAAALVGAASLIVLLWMRASLQYELEHSARATVGETARHRDGTWTFLGTGIVWLAFAFFFCVTFAFGALQNFAPTLLSTLYGLSVAVATSALSVYLIAGSVGLVIGGFLAKESKAFEYTIAGALFSSAFVAFVLAWAKLPGWMVVPAMGLMGFGVGLSGPSRDMLVRTATKARLGENAFGRVYGFVYSGLDVGLAVAPLAFGILLDQKLPQLVFVGAGCAFLFAIVTALALGRAGAAAGHNSR